MLLKTGFTGFSGASCSGQAFEVSKAQPAGSIHQHEEKNREKALAKISRMAWRPCAFSYFFMSSARFSRLNALEMHLFL